METMREYLASLSPPLAKMGRGRFSSAAWDEIEKQVSAGRQFSDYKPRGAAAPVKSERVKMEKPAKKNVDSGGVMEDPEPIWENAGWHVFHDGKKIAISGREVCRRCGYSLDYQACAEPLFPIGLEMLVVMR